MSRSEQITTDRRRRTDTLGGKRKRLAIDDSKLDHENFVYRFANDDDKGRIHQLTVTDDWEVVTDRSMSLKSDTAGDGTQVSIQAGTGDRGAPLKSILLRKAKRYHDEDIAARQRRIDETEAGLRQGAAPGASNDGQMYIPKGGITLNRD